MTTTFLIIIIILWLCLYVFGKKAEAYNYKRQKEQNQRLHEALHEALRNDALLQKYAIKKNIVLKSFEILSLTELSSEEDVKRSYRELSKKHHPDTGGNKETFVNITNAKNNCLKYIKNGRKIKI